MFSPSHFSQEKAEAQREQTAAVPQRVRGGARLPATSNSKAQAIFSFSSQGPGHPGCHPPVTPTSTLLFQARDFLRGKPSPALLGPMFWLLACLCGILAWNQRERNLGSGNYIPLSLIKMQICTVNEEGNLEAILLVTQGSHRCLSSQKVGLRIWETYALPPTTLRLAALHG